MKLALATTALSLVLGTQALAVERSEVIDTYVDIAAAKYADSLSTARTLQDKVAALIADPSEAALEEARKAWKAARVPYQQTEVYRFGNAIVDDWEGKVNAWPLDEGLIDYVDASYGGGEENGFAALNVVANPTFILSGSEIDATEITPELLSETLHEADGVEANVATGYHAIEFLLWGQDLNGHAPGAGDRPWTDYATGADCTNGNCDRRGDYLRAATELLVSDLEYMAAQWAEGGAARAEVTADETAGLSAILTGMGSLSYGEQAGERMRLGLMLNDPATATTTTALESSRRTSAATRGPTAPPSPAPPCRIWCRKRTPRSMRNCATSSRPRWPPLVTSRTQRTTALPTTRCWSAATNAAKR